MDKKKVIIGISAVCLIGAGLLYMNKPAPKETLHWQDYATVKVEGTDLGTTAWIEYSELPEYETKVSECLQKYKDGKLTASELNMALNNNWCKFKEDTSKLFNDDVITIECDSESARLLGYEFDEGFTHTVSGIEITGGIDMSTISYDPKDIVVLPPENDGKAEEIVYKEGETRYEIVDDVNDYEFKDSYKDESFILIVSLAQVEEAIELAKEHDIACITAGETYWCEIDNWEPSEFKGATG